MSGAKALTLLLLCLVAGMNAQSPTSAPTSVPQNDDSVVPTSAPTAAPDDDTEENSPTPSPPGTPDGNTPTPSPKTADGNTTNTGGGNDNGNGTTATTAAPSTTVKKTSFKVELGVANAADFDEPAYLKSVAAAAGVDVSAVKVVSRDFVVKVSYQFADDSITVDDCKKGAATMAGVDETAVTCTLSEAPAARRLQGSMGRRLAKVAALEITSATAAGADAIATTAANGTAIIEGIQTAVNKTFAVPTVTSAPAIKVIVQTEITSDTDLAAVVSATAFTTDLTTKLKEETNKDFTATVEDVTTTEETVTTTTKVQDSETESSSARKQTVSVLMAFACLSFFAN